MNSIDYKTLFYSLKKCVEMNYRMQVTVGSVAGAYIGQFDGQEIWVDVEKNPEEAFFTLAHLFGHSVQWNVDEKTRRFGTEKVEVKEEDLPGIYEYERQASQYGLAILEEAGCCGLAQWLTNYFESDWKFLKHFYLTGESVRFDKDIDTGKPVIKPLAIPKFTPQRWPARWAF